VISLQLNTPTFVEYLKYKKNMKQSLLYLLGFILSSGTSFGQCPPAGYTANGQAAVDNFAVLYPNCTEISGVLFIFGDVNNLDAFSNISSVNGNLILGSSADNIDISGFSNLINVSGDLIIQGNSGLNSLESFGNLVSVGARLRFDQNPLLTSLSGLENLISVGGDVQIQSNASLLNLNGIQGLNQINGELFIGFNESLTSLQGLNNIESIDGRMYISSCAALNDMSSLENLLSVGDYLFISQCGVTSLDGLHNLQSIGTYLNVQLNFELTSIEALNHPISIGGFISFTNNSQLSDCAVQAVCEILEIDVSLVSANGNAPGCASTDQIVQACNCADENLDYTSLITTCGSYTLLGNTYTQSGTYFVPYTNVSGCSGTITLNLTLNPLNVEMQVDGNILTAVGNFNNIVWLDCNNNFEAIQGASFPVFTATQSGSYAFEAQDGTCILQSECETVVVTSVDEELNNAIAIFPNPVKDILRINNTSDSSISNLRFYNISGKLINEISTLGQSEINVDLNDYIPGIYLLEIISDSATQNLKIVKQ
jgi:hypothetical protein